VIQTRRLDLIPCVQEDLEAILQDKAVLAARLQVTIPESWPTFPESFDYAYYLLKLEPSLAARGWWVYLFIHTHERALVGSGGFKAEPDVKGAVEIGYEIASEYRNRGLATEAAQGMIAYAFAHPEVTVVEAQTSAEPNPSTRVLEKVGMACVRTVYGTEDGDLWHWCITRQTFQARYRPSACSTEWRDRS
jgi:ribosomal-protein-alanine N-acetyltransferase